MTSFAFRFLFNLAAFWLVDDRGAGVLAMVASTFFSGQIVPIAFFPDWLSLLAWALPFAAMVQAPLVDLTVEEPDIEDVVRRIYAEG